MAASFLTTDDVKDVLKGIIAKKSSATLSDRWTPIVPRAISQAKSDIYMILLTSGFSKATIDAWDFLSEHHERQSVFWSLTHGAAMHRYEDRYIKTFDIREDLREMTAILVNGVLVSPDNTDSVAQFNEADWTGSDFRPDSPEGDLNLRLGMKTSRRGDD